MTEFTTATPEALAEYDAELERAMGTDLLDAEAERECIAETLNERYFEGGLR